MTLDKLRKIADGMGYELRRKGTRQSHRAAFDADGKQLRNCFLPHLASTASVRARTIKVLQDVRGKFIKEHGVYIDWCDAWEVLLRVCEHSTKHMYLRRGLCRLRMSVCIAVGFFLARRHDRGPEA